MKYAVVRSGGKQYIAREGETIEVDRLSLEIGKPVNFDEVLLITDGKKVQVGGPLVKGASVKGKVLDQFKSKKIIVFKYIPKERYRRKKGHRQHYTRVAIEEIVTGNVKPAAAAEPAAKETVSTTQTAAKPAAAKAAAKKPAAKKPAAKKSAAKKPASKSETAAKPKASKKPASSPKSASSTKDKPAAKSGGTKSTTSKKSTTASKKPADKKDK